MCCIIRHPKFQGIANNLAFSNCAALTQTHYCCSSEELQSFIKGTIRHLQ